MTFLCNRWYKLPVILLIFVFCIADAKTTHIRVLLKQYSLKEKSNISIASGKGFIIGAHQTKPSYYRKENLVISLVNEKVFIKTDARHIKSIVPCTFFVIPHAKSFYLENQHYHGIIKCHVDETKKQLLLINILPLDEYLYSVLRYESLSFWPLEMQKVQAVASRTYALYQMFHNKHYKYDIKNTNAHQIYRGIHNCNHLRQAVQETKGLFLTYKGKPALTMFDICCGSLIPAHMKDKDHKKPYLYRSHACTFCKTKKDFAWYAVLNKKNVLETLRTDTKILSKTKNLGMLTRVCIHEKDKAGVVHHLALHGTKGKCLITPQKLARSLGIQLKSTAFSLTEAQEELVLSGLGFGHNVGLCQLGARELVARSWNFKQILQFYFPGTHFLCIA